MPRCPATRSIPATLITVAVLGWFAWGPAHAVVGVLGFPDLFTETRVSVVYPVEGPDAETARRSAERRAAFLREVHGVEAETYPDADVPRKALAGNLLLLGYDNALIGTERFPSPFEVTGGVIRFLGLSFAGDVDLGFTASSPFNPERRVYFWSRIDPERDRFMVLPDRGSDWMVMRDYAPIALGMLSKTDAARPLERDREGQQDFREALAPLTGVLTTRDVGRYRVIYDERAFAPEQIERIGRARNRALSSAISVFGDPDPELRVTLQLYVDTERKGMRTGVEGPVHSLPSRSEIHMLPRYAATPNGHEEIHLLAHRAFGPTVSTALYEGLSFSFEDTIQGQPLSMHGAVMLDEDRLPAMATLLDEEALRKLPQTTAFAASGLMAKFLRTTFGLELFGRLYAAADPSLATLAAWLEREDASLERAFVAYVRELAEPHAGEVEALELFRTAERQQIDGDYAGLAETMRRVLEIRPGDPQLIFNLASAEMRARQFRSAERHLLAVLDHGLPRDHELVIFGHYQLGRLYDVMGRREDAVRQYRKVLELPDLHDSHQSARDALEIPYTLERLE